ncbi:MAG: hydrogenase [Lentisphaerae bacterium]|jgi:Ni,Fe-hydrogenase III large subunit|nr:hydrogenase [Lentisphaerota bacterium]
MRAAALRHLKPLPVTEVPVLSMRAFRREILASVEDGWRLVSFHGAGRPDDAVRLTAVLALDSSGELKVLAADPGESYPALTPVCPQAGPFEREIAEQWGVTPEGHPWLKPLRFHGSYRPGHVVWPELAGENIQPSVMDFFDVEGEGIHEVAVGPVHAGIIEPGHFRFHCHGEQVLHLEISLGYQHRGVERALLGGPHPRTIHHMETLAGDTTIGHATTYCRAVEALAGCQAPPRARALRAVSLELERLSNHTGDLGALAGDVGYLPTASFCGRLRGDFLNMTAMLCGSRFGRGLVRPGGVGFDVDAGLTARLLESLEDTCRDVAGAVNLLWETSSVRARFEQTGTVSAAMAVQLGLVGPAARASGREMDVRRDFPADDAHYDDWSIAMLTSGDVMARARVRWLEIQRSAEFIRRCLADLPEGPVRMECGPPAADSLVVSMTEGWRGEIVHVAQTGAAGRFARYKVVDPSFHNWMGLAMALRGQEISDFPLCNKSFNLSYCGHDL